MEFTKEQIDKHKSKHGDVFRVTVGGKQALLRRPTRAELGYAMQAGRDNPIRFNEAILNACWLDGDAEIKTDDSLFLGVSSVIDQLVHVAEAALEKP